MNLVDLALAILLLLCVLRGFWRGLIRESFGFAAFVAGLLAALRFTDSLAAKLATWEALAAVPDSARIGAAFAVIFLAVSAAINIVGFVFDKLLGSGVLRQASNLGGGVFGLVKGGAVLSFVLLFFQLFPFVPAIDAQLASSRLAPPMISAANDLLRGNWSRSEAAQEPT